MGSTSKTTVFNRLESDLGALVVGGLVYITLQGVLCAPINILDDPKHLRHRDRIRAPEHKKTRTLRL